MKRKINILLAVLLFSVYVSGTAFADESVTTETIGNLTFEVPTDWSVSTKEADDSTTVTYSSGDGAALVVMYLPVDFNLDDYDESSQRKLLDALLSSFESYDNYVEFSNEDSVFENRVANTRIFTYDSNNKSYYAAACSMYTGEGLAAFVYGVLTSTGKDSSLDVFSDIVDTIKTDSTNIKNTETKNEAKEYTKYSANIYKVGTDIPAGEYVVFAEEDHGYFCVSPDSNQDDITFNDNFDYNSIITVNDGEYLELSGCYAVPFDENPEVDLAGSGMFKVGTHIPAGEYKLEVTGSHGYYCIYPDSRQDDIIANDNFENQNYVTVSDGQYLILSGCKFADTPTKPMKSYTDTDTVKKVQESLNAAGYDCGTPDGIAGSGTKAAIEKYQTDNGMTVTGTITDELLEELGI